MKGKRSLFAEIWRYSMETKKIWLFLLMVFLMALGTIILLTESAAVMPFIYSLF